jgi:hypothetical protein
MCKKVLNRKKHYKLLLQEEVITEVDKKSFKSQRFQISDFCTSHVQYELTFAEFEKVQFYHKYMIFVGLHIKIFSLHLAHLTSLIIKRGRSPLNCF